MDMRNGWRGAMRRVKEQLSVAGSQLLEERKPPLKLRLNGAPVKEIEAAGNETARRTVPLPSILTPGAPTLMRAGVLPKPTPANLRRFAETPIARRAINIVKDRVAGMQWRIERKKSSQLSVVSSQNIDERMAILAENFEAPNPEDSFRSMIEQVLEDVLVGGFGAIELDLTGDDRRPLVLWPVDGASIRIKSDWDGNPASPRYVQATGQFAPNTEITLADEELAYIRLNPRTHTPFGLGKLEVAFETIHEFLGAHRYAARLASNTVVQYALWLQNLTPQHHERLIRWWQDEIEGTGKVPILSAESKPEVLRFGAGTDADLRLQWQEFLIRMIANAFDLPPMLLGLERDVNRNTATTQSDDAFRTAVVPVARLIAEHLTRDVISKRLGWNDLQFVFTDVDAPNELEQAQIQQILVGCGVLTVNEVRRMKGLPPLEVSTGGMADAPAME
jgi:HK97 family phage portal protein